MLFDELITEYINSEVILFLDQELKEHAESLLQSFFNNCKEPLSLENIESALNKLLLLGIPPSVKKKLPYLLKEFFEFLDSRGRLPNANSIYRDLEILETQFIKKVREDGSVKGTTHKKNYTEVGRNNPCPCGSGKKFKKCCLNLISD